MSKAGEIPYSWDQMEAQIREAILCQASMLEHFGPSPTENIVAAYLGFDPGETLVQDLTKEQIESIDIRSHGLYDQVRIAYHYAYQLEEAERAAPSSWDDIDGLLQGFPETDANGEPSPFCTLNDFPLRRMLETFRARYGLHEFGFAVSTRELALLSNMTVPAVRTALSREGFKLEKSQGTSRSRPEGSDFKLTAGDALLWLSKRRGYIPNRPTTSDQQHAIREIVCFGEDSFPGLLRRVMALIGQDAATVAEVHQVDRAWLEKLVEGEAAEPDLDALCRLARGLQAPEPEFVSQAVRHLLRTEAGG